MNPIGDFVKRCVPLSQEEYSKKFPRPVLVHEAGATDLQAVGDEELPGRTINRMGPPRKETEDSSEESGPQAITRVTPTSKPDELYQVYELQPRRETSASVSIGCSPECEVVINDRSISRIHAYLETRGGKHLLWDNDSAAGTKLNDTKLESGQMTPVSSGDRVCFGAIPLIFLLPDDFYRLVRALFID